MPKKTIKKKRKSKTKSFAFYVNSLKNPLKIIIKNPLKIIIKNPLKIKLKELIQYNLLYFYYIKI